MAKHTHTKKKTGSQPQKEKPSKHFWSVCFLGALSISAAIVVYAAGTLILTTHWSGSTTSLPYNPNSPLYVFEQLLQFPARQLVSIICALVLASLIVGMMLCAIKHRKRQKHSKEVLECLTVFGTFILCAFLIWFFFHNGFSSVLLMLCVIAFLVSLGIAYHAFKADKAKVYRHETISLITIAALFLAIIFSYSSIVSSSLSDMPNNAVSTKPTLVLGANTGDFDGAQAGSTITLFDESGNKKTFLLEDPTKRSLSASDEQQSHSVDIDKYRYLRAILDIPENIE